MTLYSIEDNDAELVFSAQRGDKEAYGKLARKYQQILYHIALAYLQNEFDAEDAVQETLITAYLQLRSLRDPAKFGNWIRKILKWHCFRKKLRIRRVSKITKSISELEEAEKKKIKAETVISSVENEYEKKELKLAVREAIESLPPKYREVIVLHYVDGLKYREISNLLGISQKAVERIVYRAKKILRKSLKKYILPNNF